ncbi:hypothetical protein SmJEL517_g02443 [Synchytrium microbalum]|uniref:Glutathione S-transferase kappa 1 n=1 Tax=Synchytrium microbalum TaxID=1806994 RepID=A0A507C5V3_9FUNG|nr:uncharacterized protein SmJEL517_g02443 [Synchytrium microbalum]TPX35022.1 hypothetical protein SmJEL517_g02443 [Synchytrium microbalum]
MADLVEFEPTLTRAHHAYTLGDGCLGMVEYPNGPGDDELALRLQRYSALWNIKIDLRPCLLGGVHKATGNQPPMVNAWKGKNMLEMLPLVAQMMDVQLKRPKKFPTPTVKVMRILTAIKLSSPEHLAAASEGMWKLLHCEQGDIDSDEELVAKLATIMGTDEAKKMLEASTSKPVKDELIRATEEAVKEGAFGNPWIVAVKDGKKVCFFGDDSFERVCFFLGKDNLGPNPSEQIKKLKATGYSPRL